MSDDFTFDDFDEEPFGDETPKPPPAKPARPAAPPQAPPSAKNPSQPPPRMWEPPAAPSTPQVPPAAKSPSPAPTRAVASPVTDSPPLDFSSPQDDFDEEIPEVAPKKQKGKVSAGDGRRKTLLLVLLLVLVAGAGGYYYLYGLPWEEPVTPVQPVAVKPTAKPAPPVAAVPQPAQTPSVAATTPVKQPPTTATAVPASAGAPLPAAKTAPPPATGAVPPVTGASQALPAPAKPAAVAQAPVSQPVAAKSTPQATPPSAATDGAYYLTSGPFIDHKQAKLVEKILRGLGYEPRRSTVKRSTDMTRLRVGSFGPQEVEAKRAELAKYAPGAFVLVRDEQWILYAGSFHELAAARREADKLYRNGYRVTEEKVQVEIPMDLLRFGAFPDRPAAEQAAAQVRTTGSYQVEVAQRR